MATRTRITALFEFLKLVFDGSDDILYVMGNDSLLHGCHIFSRRSSVPKIKGFVENVVPQYSLQDFTMHFRIGKGVFEIILTELWDDLLTENVGGSEPVSPEKQLLLFLWYMANEGESMREVAHQFGLSKSIVCSKIKKVCKAVIARLTKAGRISTALLSGAASRRRLAEDTQQAPSPNNIILTLGQPFTALTPIAESQAKQQQLPLLRVFGLARPRLEPGSPSPEVDALPTELSGLVIHWPSNEEQQQLSREFNTIYNIEGVVGLLDGTHIMLSGCVGGDADWINRSRYPLIQLQVVVDHSMKILNAVTGWPGCVHDARVLRNSSLYREAEARQAMQGDKFIIADSAYPLRRWLITPFINNGHLIRQQRQFNRRISSCRQTVERAIGHLKGRFRRLKELPFHSEDEVGEIITAGCILHNICILEEDYIEHYIELGQHERPNRYDNVFPNAQDGVARRMMLMNLLNGQ